MNISYQIIDPLTVNFITHRHQKRALIVVKKRTVIAIAIMFVQLNITTIEAIKSQQETDAFLILSLLFTLI